VHTSEGKYLVNRLVPCPYCLMLYGKNPDAPYTDSNNDNTSWKVFSLSKSGTQSKRQLTGEQSMQVAFKMGLNALEKKYVQIFLRMSGNYRSNLMDV